MLWLAVRCELSARCSLCTGIVDSCARKWQQSKRERERESEIKIEWEEERAIEHERESERESAAAAVRAWAEATESQKGNAAYALY